MNEKIFLKLNELALLICKRYINKEKLNSTGLLTGDSGCLLFLFKYYKYTNDNLCFELSNDLLERLLEELSDGNFTYSYCNGLPGILSLINYLNRNDYVDIDVSDSKASIDVYLLRELENCIYSECYDFMHGALGIGFYYINDECNEVVLTKLIEFLNITKEIVNNGIYKWKSFLGKDLGYGYNISLSHGISSIIIFLSRVINTSKCEYDLCCDLLNGAVNYVLSQEIDHLRYGYYFPNYSSDFICYDLYKSRLAWCYGDLGVAYSLFCAGKVLNNTLWVNKAIQIFLYTTNRRDLFDNNVNEPGICHGSVGVAMIFRRMYLETKNIIFKKTYDYWLEQTLHKSVFSDGLAGYKSLIEKKWVNDYSLLTGIAGIGLNFISYLSNDEQEWDSLFLL